MIIEKKVQRPYFEAILDGTKKYELRLADFSCAVGDTLRLKEWDAKTEQCTGRQIEKKITMVLKTKDLEFWSDEDIAKYGYQIISFA